MIFLKGLSITCSCAKSFLVTATTCSLNRSCESRKTPKLCTILQWGSTTLPKVKDEISSDLESTNIHSHLVLVGLSWRLFFPIQTYPDFKHGDRTSTASFGWSRVERYNWVLLMIPNNKWLYPVILCKCWKVREKGWLLSKEEDCCKTVSSQPHTANSEKYLGWWYWKLLEHKIYAPLVIPALPQVIYKYDKLSQ